MKNKKIIYSVISLMLFMLITILSNNIPIKIDVGELPIKFSLEENSDLQILYFNVGQADATLIVNNGKTMLIDAGNNEDGKLLVEYLKKLGIEKIDYLIGTHTHEDHIGGMDDIINNLDIGTFFMPYVEKTKTKKEYNEVKEATNNKNILIENPAIGQKFMVGNASCIVKYVDNEQPSNLNNSSIIIEMTVGENNYLFMGDAEKQVENKESIKWKEIDVLKVGHHGSDTSSTERFIKITSPEISIISVGANNKYGHPKDLVLNILTKICNEVYRTDKDGTLFLVKEKDTNKIIKLKTKVDGNI